MKIFLMEASLIFSMASRIFSALALAAASSGLLLALSWTVLGLGTAERTELLMVIVDLDFSPLESLLELLEMLSQKAESLSGLSMLVVVVPVEAVEILLAWWQEKSLMNFQLKIEIARLELQLLHPNAAFKTRFKTNYWLGRRPVLV